MPLPTSYANVASTLALVVALSGTGAYAAGLAKDSVKSKHIKDGAVRSSDLALGSVGASKLADRSVTAAKLAPGAVPDAAIPDGAITGAKLAPDSVTSAKVAPNSLTSADIDESSLSTVPRAGNVLAASVNTDGSLNQVRSYGAVSAQVTLGAYIVTFNRSLAACSVVGSARSFSAVSVSADHSGGNYVTVRPNNPDGTAAAGGFDLVVVC